MKKLLPLLLLVVLAALALGIRRCNQTAPAVAQQKTTPAREASGYNGRGLNRSPEVLVYSHHARCRMQCRHIDESEVKQILREGTINYRKSELKGAECSKKYAVEGYSSDKQHLRIIVAPCGQKATVVTVIDIGEEWPCDCK